MLQKGRTDGTGGERGGTGSVTHPDWWLQQTDWRLFSHSSGKKKTSFSSFSHVSIVQCTPDTNVVLLLRHLGRNADADLVEPLVTAAVTLDPIHLKDTRKLLMTFILNIANI